MSYYENIEGTEINKNTDSLSRVSAFKMEESNEEKETPSFYLNYKEQEHVKNLSLDIKTADYYSLNVQNQPLKDLEALTVETDALNEEPQIQTNIISDDVENLQKNPNESENITTDPTLSNQEGLEKEQMIQGDHAGDQQNVEIDPVSGKRICKCFTSSNMSEYQVVLNTNEANSNEKGNDKDQLELSKCDESSEVFDNEARSEVELIKDHRTKEAEESTEGDIIALSEVLQTEIDENSKKVDDLRSQSHDMIENLEAAVISNNQDDTTIETNNKDSNNQNEDNSSIFAVSEVDEISEAISEEPWELHESENVELGIESIQTVEVSSCNEEEFEDKFEEIKNETVQLPLSDENSSLIETKDEHPTTEEIGMQETENVESNQNEGSEINSLKSQISFAYPIASESILSSTKSALDLANSESCLTLKYQSETERDSDFEDLQENSELIVNKEVVNVWSDDIIGDIKKSETIEDEMSYISTSSFNTNIVDSGVSIEKSEVEILNDSKSNMTLTCQQSSVELVHEQAFTESSNNDEHNLADEFSERNELSSKENTTVEPKLIIEQETQNEPDNDGKMLENSLENIVSNFSISQDPKLQSEINSRDSNQIKFIPNKSRVSFKNPEIEEHSNTESTATIMCQSEIIENTNSLNMLEESLSTVVLETSGSILSIAATSNTEQKADDDTQTSETQENIDINTESKPPADQNSVKIDEATGKRICQCFSSSISTKQSQQNVKETKSEEIIIGKENETIKASHSSLITEIGPSNHLLHKIDNVDDLRDLSKILIVASVPSVITRKIHSENEDKTVLSNTSRVMKIENLSNTAEDVNDDGFLDLPKIPSNSLSAASSSAWIDESISFVPDNNKEAKVVTELTKVLKEPSTRVVSSEMPKQLEKNINDPQPSVVKKHGVYCRCKRFIRRFSNRQSS